MGAEIDLLAHFGAALRDAGLPVGTGEVITLAEAVGTLDPALRDDVYWAGRVTLVTSPEQVAMYDRVFARFFGSVSDAGGGTSLPSGSTDARGSANTAEIAGAAPSEAAEGSISGHGSRASDDGVLDRTPFTRCTPEELAAIVRMMRSLRLTPPRRRSRRFVPARRGRQPDLRRTARDTMRAHGELQGLRWRRNRLRHRPLVLILDVSGSMQATSRALLQFAWAGTQASRRTEVFVFGTRLTRITAQLRRTRLDDALARATDDVVDFAGGTRIGESIDAFVRDHGRRGLARGGIVVVCSDGLDKGRVADLARAVHRLSRQCHRLLWLSPLPPYAPSPGMDAVRPYVDAMPPGRDLRDLTALAGQLESIERQGRRARTRHRPAQSALPDGVTSYRPLRTTAAPRSGH